MASTNRVSQDETTAGGSDAGAQTVSLDGVTKTFAGGQIVACENIDLEVDPDEFVVLLGPSGCGKTTTLRCIAGLEIPDSGSITIGNREVTDAKPKDRNLAFVFQTIALFPHKSVRGNISFGLDMKTDLSADEKDARVREAAEILGIEELLDRQPSELSGGQQQRVSLGRAMVMEPAAFLLDEPFSALDANLRDQMQTEIKRLHRELETAMVFVTHDQEEAMTLGDKIVIMEDGNIQQIGTPYEIYNQPENQFVAEFIGSPSANMIDCRLEERDDDLVLENDAFELSLDGIQRTERLEGRLGDSVTLGVRPENIGLGGEGQFDAEVTLIEPKGARDVVFFQRGDMNLRATTGQGSIEGRNTIPVNVSTEEIWIFDEEGERLV